MVLGRRLLSLFHSHGRRPPCGSTCQARHVPTTCSYNTTTTRHPKAVFSGNTGFPLQWLAACGTLRCIPICECTTTAHCVGAYVERRSHLRQMPRRRRGV